MNIRRIPWVVLLLLLLLLAALHRDAQGAAASPAASQPLAENPSPPASPVKLIFVHHSTGGNWLADPGVHEYAGGLGRALMNNNYYVSATNYGWEVNGDAIGDRTDIGHWWEWFRGPNSAAIMSALYRENGQHIQDGWWPRRTDPGGENEIIMFKSCFSNSHLGGRPNDPPTTGSNPLRGQDAWSEHMTVANAKGIYNDILEYFSTRQDKLFIVITAPPLHQSETDATHAANVRAFNDWLVNTWLSGYPYANVAVFDFYNVLTSNGGSATVNDLDLTTGNHHRWYGGTIQHVHPVNNNYSAYAQEGDSHPLSAGGQKATGEFVSLLNIYYHRWRGTSPGPANTPTVTPLPLTATPTGHPPTATSTPTISPALATATPTSVTRTPGTGTQEIVLQQGVRPDASYDGCRDALISLAGPGVNVGGLENLEIFWADDQHRRSLLWFDLSPLPDDARIEDAVLELYRYGGDAPAAMTIVVNRVTRPWLEGSGWNLWPEPPYIPDGVTWLIASPGTPWTTPGGDFDDTTDFGHGTNGVVDLNILPVGMANGWVRLNVTPLVRAWVEHDVPNDGLLVRPINVNGGEYAYHYYYSRDYETASLRPKLTIRYTTGEPEPTRQLEASLYLPLILKRLTTEATATPTQGITPTPSATPTRSPTPGPMPTSTGGIDVLLTIINDLPVTRVDEPLTSGVPIPRSAALRDLSTLRLLDAAGHVVPCQFTPLARWGGAPDDATKPVRWLLLDLQANVPANGVATYRLRDGGGPTPTYPPLSVSEDGAGVTIDTGAITYRLRKEDGRLEAPGWSASLYDRVTAMDGTPYTSTSPVSVQIVSQGPMRVVVHVRGSYRGAGDTKLLDYTTRYWFYAGQAMVRRFHTVENNNLCPLGEYDQLTCFDIGSGGSITVTDISFVVETGLTGPLTYQAGGESGVVSGELNAPLTVYQDSSGSDHWDTFITLEDWEGDPLDAHPRMQAEVSFRGYRTTLGEAEIDSGDHAPGWLTLSGSEGAWTVGLRDCWQNFPKALRARTNGTLEIGLFPDEYGSPDYGLNLRAGEHKTHEMVLLPDAAEPQLAAVDPLYALAPPEWIVASGAIPFLAARNRSDWPEHEDFIDYQLVTSPNYEEWMNVYPNLLVAIEETDFYGIYDYGDLPIDYEHYQTQALNAKYYMVLGMWMQWARDGDRRWRALAEAGGRHVADIDILHNLHSPRHWGDGIMFGHSMHDEDAFLNPHRNYNSGHPDLSFGVPGLMLTYYLTGYEKAWEAALELADCIEYRLHNEGTLCDFFPEGECSGKGYALGDVDGLYAANCRPAANALWIVVEAYRATGDARYLTVADALVDWGRPADQPYINDPTGADEEVRPWMLNMYLRALAEYIQMRDEFALPDTYDARGAFLGFANWLRTYPWLDIAPIAGGARGAYPYTWYFDGRAENEEPSVNNWLLVGADVLAYAHRLSGEADYLERAARLFRAGAHDPFFEGDPNTYSQTKETVNSILWGQLFLEEWARR